MQLSACYNAATEHLEWGIHFRDSPDYPATDTAPAAAPSERVPSSTPLPKMRFPSSICTRIPSVSGCDCPLLRAVLRQQGCFTRGLGFQIYWVLGPKPKHTKRKIKQQTVGEAALLHRRKTRKKAYNKSSAKAETCFGHRAK